jgi:hypothetical protein
MHRALTLFGKLGPREKGIAETHTPISKRKLTLHYSIVIIPQDSSVCTVNTWNFLGGPRTVIVQMMVH